MTITLTQLLRTGGDGWNKQMNHYITTIPPHIKLGGAPKLLRVLSRESRFLRDERICMLRTECSYVFDGRCDQKCWRHDRRFADCVQSYPSSSHYHGAYRNHFWLRCSWNSWLGNWLYGDHGGVLEIISC